MYFTIDGWRDSGYYKNIQEQLPVIVKEKTHNLYISVYGVIWNDYAGKRKKWKKWAGDKGELREASCAASPMLHTVF